MKKHCPSCKSLNVYRIQLQWDWGYEIRNKCRHCTWSEFVEAVQMKKKEKRYIPHYEENKPSQE